MHEFQERLRVRHLHHVPDFWVAIFRPNFVQVEGGSMMVLIFSRGSRYLWRWNSFKKACIHIFSLMCTFTLRFTNIFTILLSELIIKKQVFDFRINAFWRQQVLRKEAVIRKLDA